MDPRALPPINRSGAARRFRGATAGSLAAILVTALLLAPLAWAWMPEGSAGPARVTVLPGIPWKTLAVSLAVTATAGALAVIIGAALAAALVLTDLPGRAFWATVALVPFVCPATVWALGQAYCYGSGGLMERCWPAAWHGLRAFSDPRHYIATCLVLAGVHAPLAMLIIGRGLGRLQHAGLEAAALFLTPWARVRWAAGAIRQEVAAAFLLVLALGLGNFGVPHVLQCPLYSNEIYLRVANYLDHAGAMQAALPLLAVTVAAAAAIAWAERKTAYVQAHPAPPPARVRLGRKAWLVGGLLTAYLAGTSLLPTAAIIGECRSPGSFLKVVSDAAEETENTLWIALAASLVACLAGVVVGSWVGRSWRVGLDAVTMAPLGVPALILGLAYLRFFNAWLPAGWALVGSGPLVLAMAARGWPFTTRLIVAARRRIAPEWQEAAELAGPGSVARWRRIDGPMILDHAVAGAVVAFVLAVGDVEISHLLSSPGSGTLAMRLFTFLHFGPTHVAAGLSLLLLALAAAPVIVYFLLTDRCLRII